MQAVSLQQEAVIITDEALHGTDPESAYKYAPVQASFDDNDLCSFWTP